MEEVTINKENRDLAVRAMKFIYLNVDAMTRLDICTLSEAASDILLGNKLLDKRTGKDENKEVAIQLIETCLNP